MHLVELGLYSFIYNVLYSFLWGNIGTYKDFMGIHGNLMGLPGLIFTVAGNFSAHRGSLEDSVKAVVDTMLPDYASKLTIFAGDVPWMPWPGGWEQRNLSPFSMVTSRNHGDHLSLIHHPISIIYIYPFSIWNWNDHFAQWGLHDGQIFLYSGDLVVLGWTIKSNMLRETFQRSSKIYTGYPPFRHCPWMRQAVKSIWTKPMISWTLLPGGRSRLWSHGDPPRPNVVNPMP